eukprot:270587-Prymnesium_polylepis.1
MLVRAHVVLGHPTVEKLIATIKQAKNMSVGAITKDDIKAFHRRGCGHCDLIKRNQPAFKMSKGVTDLTPSPVGKRWVKMDTLKLRTVSFLATWRCSASLTPPRIRPSRSAPRVRRQLR